MLAESPVATLSTTTERDLRERIDHSVSRALVDREYARALLVDPTLALESHGCAPQHFRMLRGIRATDVLDFARQARALFWIEPYQPSDVDLQDLARAAVGR